MLPMTSGGHIRGGAGGGVAVGCSLSPKPQMRSHEDQIVEPENIAARALATCFKRASLPFRRTAVGVEYYVSRALFASSLSGICIPEHLKCKKHHA